MRVLWFELLDGLRDRWSILLSRLPWSHAGPFEDGQQSLDEQE